MSEKRDAGLLVATSGITFGAMEALAEIDKTLIRVGDKAKIASLCKVYTKVMGGLYLPRTALPKMLMEETFLD